MAKQELTWNPLEACYQGVNSAGFAVVVLEDSFLDVVGELPFESVDEARDPDNWSMDLGVLVGIDSAVWKG